MAWGDVEASLQKKLYDARTAAGIKRQPALKEDYLRLADTLGGPLKTPYGRFDNDLHKNMCLISSFFEIGAHWELGDSSNSHYFYRLENFESFQKKNKDYFISPLESLDALWLEPDDDKTVDNFNLIVDEFHELNDWIALEKLSTLFFNHRGISWWTNSFEYSIFDSKPVLKAGSDYSRLNKWIIEFALKIGFATDWFSENLLFLRLDARKINQDNIRVPSIIDAFCQPIFFPRDIDHAPKWGLAYDLETTPNPGYREFVIKDIPVSAIELIPVRLNLKTLEKFAGQARLSKKLVEDLIKNI